MRPGPLALAAVLLASCAHDDWTFRPLDADASAVDDGEAGAPDGADAPLMEVSVAPDVVDASTPPEVSVGDVGGDADASTPADAPEVSVRITLWTAAFATGGAAPATVGTLRLVEGGFARGSRVCSDGLCLTGGFQ